MRRAILILVVSLLILLVTLVQRWASPPNPVQSQVAVVPPAQNLVVTLQDRLRLNPDDVDAYALLGLTLLQRVRDTGDASLYIQAEQALNAALERNPDHLDAIIGQGILALARHDFVAALDWGQQAKAINPHRAQVYGIIGDAQVELGRYEAAVETIQTMVDTRPDLNSYSRVSYIRELHGDMPGAIEAMQRAVDSGVTNQSDTLWAHVHLGHLHFKHGDLPQAEHTYRRILQIQPDYMHAQVGLARIHAANGNHNDAIAIYEDVVRRLPLPEFVIELGELYDLTGQPAKAQQQYALVEAIAQLHIAAGMNLDLELALFEANHGDPVQAVQQARKAYQERPNIYAADTLAWALYRAGYHAEAYKYSQEALRLGTQDPLLLHHAQVIAKERDLNNFPICVASAG